MSCETAFPCRSRGLRCRSSSSVALQQPRVKRHEAPAFLETRGLRPLEPPRVASGSRSGPSSIIRRLAALLAFAFAPTLAFPDALLDVAGGVEALSPVLRVRVTLTNRGDQPAGPVDVTGELFGERRQARHPGTLAPAASADVTLAFSSSPPRSGVHALALRLEHPVPGPPDGAGNPPTTSQPAWLLLAFGVSPAEAVRVEAAPLRLDVRGSLQVRLTSLDGAAHRVSLRAQTGSGLRVEVGAIDVAVGSRDQASAEIPIVRTGAPRGSRQPLVLIAETSDGEAARTTVAVATVEITPDPGLLPALRPTILAAGLVLLLFALVYEARTDRRRSAPTARA